MANYTIMEVILASWHLPIVVACLISLFSIIGCLIKYKGHRWEMYSVVIIWTISTLAFTVLMFLKKIGVLSFENMSPITLNNISLLIRMQVATFTAVFFVAVYLGKMKWGAKNGKH